ncbi:MAG: hypothetical protein IT285_00260 [Bdellovibrionales bacterium]|nr:hypothetical protein [Bdellovibrionales bacterium]
MTLRERNVAREERSAPKTMFFLALIGVLAFLWLRGEARANGNTGAGYTARYGSGQPALTTGALSTRESCTSIRLDRDGGPLSRIPVLDQGSRGICFAFSAAQLADAWRFSHPLSDGSISGGAGHLSSPLPISIASAVDAGRRYEFEGGLTEEALRRIRLHGSCDQNAIFSATGGRDPNDGARSDRLTQHIRQSIDDFIDALRTRPDPSDPWETRYTLAMRQLQHVHPDWAISRVAAQARYQIAQPFAQAFCSFLESEGLPLPGAPQGGLVNSAQVLAAYLARAVDLGTGDTDFYARYFENVCRGHTERFTGVIPTEQSRFFPPGRNEAPELRSTLHRLISRGGAQPVGIDICTNMIRSVPPYRGMHYRTEPDGRRVLGCTADPALPQDSGDGTHAVVVAGRRWNESSGRCQFLVRNSWGTSCAGYPSELDCEQGSLWVDEADVGESTFNLTWLGAP